MTTLSAYWDNIIERYGRRKALFLQPIQFKIIPFLGISTLVLFAIRYGMLHYLWSADEIPQNLIHRAQQTPAWVLIFLIPCLEEVFFRWLLQGMVLHHFLLKGKAAWLAILLSGIVFGLAHQYFLMILAAALMGIFLAWTFWYYKSLYAPIFVHVLNNALVLFMM
jgi:membrane protease YdiL (CAAX protease family)